LLDGKFHPLSSPTPTNEANSDFGKSALTNPYPSFNLWHVLASLLNKPADKLTNSHYFVVNTILHIGSRKLCSIYGYQARKLVEVAVGPWAQRGMQSGIAGAHAVQSTGLFLRKQPWWNAA
jgi:nucleoporin GLE1